ncbi:MAG: type I-U CRISPR-associated protein Csb2, partial [Thermoanaerobaculum sp.]|nr:type I-U CRISPR-associated protein Csb2 [Thermoanaerobaculum sp.]
SFVGRGAWITFVPTNQSDITWDRQHRLTGKEARYLLFDPRQDLQVHYIWPIPYNDRPPQSLFHLSKRLVALGWGVDQASCQCRILGPEAVSQLEGALWRPLPPAPFTALYRVPQPGSLEDLIKCYESWRQRLPSPRQYRPPKQATVFATMTYLPETHLPFRFFAAFRLPEGVAFRQEQAAKVAAMIRGLTIKKAQDANLPNRETYVAGHVEDPEATPPRFSYLPLPSIGHPHADGLVRRALIAEPFGGDGSMARWAQDALHNSPLQDEHGNRLGWLRALETSDGVLARYLGPATHWVTVTPVILPGFDDRKGSKALKLVQEALVHAAVPPEAVADLSLQKAPWFSSAAHPSLYFRPNYLKSFPAWHVRLIFRRPVRGPLALGAGRHVGLGLFATV